MTDEPKAAPKSQSAAAISPTTPPAANQKPKMPSVPLKARTVLPDTEVVHRNMMDATMTVDEPAIANLSAIATRRWGELSVDAALGNQRPPKARIGLDETKQFLFMSPTTKEDKKGIKVTYDKGRATINLITAFGPNSRYVQPDYREYYEVGVTPGPVTFDDGFVGVSLYAYLVPYDKVLRRRMSEESKAKRRQTILRKKQEAEFWKQQALTQPRVPVEPEEDEEDE